MCVCVYRSRCRLAHSTAGPLQAPLPQTPLSGQELQHQKQVLPVLRVTLYCRHSCVCVNTSLNIHVCDFTSVFISGSWLLGAGSSLAAGNDSRQLIQPRLCVCLHGLCVCRVLDEVLQKLVQLIQEEECVSDSAGKVRA